MKEYIYEKRLRVYFIVRLFVRYVCKEIERERGVCREIESVCREIERGGVYAERYIERECIYMKRD